MQNMTEHKKAIEEDIFQIIYRLLEDKNNRIDKHTPLIGEDSILDSIKLVELCLLLEDKAISYGFEFDWTSTATMSKSSSMFRTTESLTCEFITQMEGAS